MQNIGQIRELIKRAKFVYIRPFFGTMHSWVKITKAEANSMLDAGFAENVTLYKAFDFDHELSIDKDKCLYMG